MKGRNRALLLLMAFSSSTFALDLQGHRGARGLMPENTLPGFAHALSIGVTTLELDTGVTRDGVVVIHHDRALNPDIARGPDGKWIEPPGARISDLSFAELQRYDVGRIRPGSDYARRFPHQKAVDGTRIPRLSQLFDEAPGSVRFNIETKIAPDAPPEPFARALIDEVRNAGVAARTTIQSFDWRTLGVVESEAPEIATSYLTSAKDADPDRVHAAGGRIWSPDFGSLTGENLARARKLGLKIVAWTVNERADIARALDMKLDGIISDYPDRVRAEMARRGLPLPAKS
jgi:glycerophosphoryl diester phosphodiesterase